MVRNFRNIIAGMAIVALMISASPADDTFANFDGGNSTAVVDAYTGMPGDGWYTSWMQSASTGTVTVIDTNPLSPGGGNYLSNDLTGSNRNVVREYGTDIDVNTPHTISWQWRLDDPFTVDDYEDRIHFFANPEKSVGSTSPTNSWIIGVAPMQMGHNNFYFYDKQVDTTFAPENTVQTPIPLIEDTTYTFEVSVDPVNRLYDATISYNSYSYTRTGLHFRGDGQNCNFLHFGSRYSDDTQMRTSLDSIAVTGGVPADNPIYDGFNGIWYYNQALEDNDYVYKYSGGFGTYPQQIAPHAYYNAESNKTFFVYGGTDNSNSTIFHMISYYDHETGQVAKPHMILDKGTTDAHDNPCMVIDDEGYIFVFSNSHGTARPSYISRSTEPYSIDEFQTVVSLPSGTNNNFSYGQPIYIEGQGFMFLHTLYTSAGRTLCYNTSSDGINWDYSWTSRPQIARMPGGQYQISEAYGQRIGTAFNYHPGGDVNARTNLYYMESSDMGQTWATIDGTSLTTPVTTVSNAALVHDYQAEGLMVYLKDIKYDDEGRPILFYMTSNDWEPGPDGDPRMFHTAHYIDGDWVIKDAFTSDHNYDFGPLYVEDDGTWRVIAPTDPGPQEYSTGGEMQMWISENEGDTWEMIGNVTSGSDYNHTYARQPIDAQDDFYSFWADGDAWAKSESRLYFTNKEGSGVWMLPQMMDGENFATPELVYSPIAGDANIDGVVNAEDVEILASNWLKNDATWRMGDFNRDGKIDDIDATLLASNWLACINASVPEPNTLILIALMGLSVLILRRKHGD